MAAREGEISGKRRRLFKALTAAPAVMTLRPGSALANQSAYQCLQNGANIAEWHDAAWLKANSPPCKDGDVCYAYSPRTYIDIREGTQVTEEVDGVDKPVPCPPYGPVFVLLDNIWVDFNMYDVTHLVSRVDGKYVLKTLDLDKNCREDIPEREGLFAVIGHAYDEGTKFAIDGVYPEKTLAGVEDAQGITGTCLDSFAPGMSNSYTLSKG